MLMENSIYRVGTKTAISMESGGSITLMVILKILAFITKDKPMVKSKFLDLAEI
jgi:hypothetical protein